MLSKFYSGKEHVCGGACRNSCQPGSGEIGEDARSSGLSGWTARTVCAVCCFVPCLSDGRPARERRTSAGYVLFHHALAEIWAVCGRYLYRAVRVLSDAASGPIGGGTDAGRDSRLPRAAGL